MNPTFHQSNRKSKKIVSYIFKLDECYVFFLILFCMRVFTRKCSHRTHNFYILLIWLPLLLLFVFFPPQFEIVIVFNTYYSFFFSLFRNQAVFISVLFLEQIECKWDFLPNGYRQWLPIHWHASTHQTIACNKRSQWV